MGKRIFIWYNSDELKQLVQLYGTDIESDVKKIIKERSLQTQTENQVTDIDSETKKWKLRKLKAETQIKEHELLHINTFGTKPSPQAQHAITEGFTQPNPQTNNPIPKIKEENAMRFLESCKKNDTEQWVIICNLCRADFIDVDLNKTKSEFFAHLQKQHPQELLA